MRVPGEGRNSGFTIVELLTVTAIAGMLVGLLLPALQGVREASRAATCAGNLRQIGTAIHTFSQVRGRLPPGGAYSGHPDSTTQNPLTSPNLLGSVTMLILPYIEQSRLYDKYDFKLTGTWSGQVGVRLDDQRIDRANNASKLIRSFEIPVYACPSDPSRPVTSANVRDTTRGTCNYFASSGSRNLSPGGNAGNPGTNPPTPPCPCSNTFSGVYYTASTGPHPAYLASGPFLVYGLSGTTAADPAKIELLQSVAAARITTRLRDVTDGLSKTIFFGESRPLCSSYANAGWGATSSGHGRVSTQVPINVDTCTFFNDPSRGATSNCNLSCNDNLAFGFKSLHRGGANFLLGDGRTAFVGESIDHWVYQALGGKADGGTIGPTNATGRKGVQAAIP
ncbi:MAG: DUF1559 domain-containing protein [Planctomycetia bacterium]|nr:DUF1559 domain-containing protein [Planctomycetia bacterium]